MHKKPKKSYIRLCDNNFIPIADGCYSDWDIHAGNSDAKCYSSKTWEGKTKKWNSKCCLKCVYNDCFDMRELNIKEERKIKLIQMKRELEFGKTKPGNHYGTYGYVEKV